MQMTGTDRDFLKSVGKGYHKRFTEKQKKAKQQREHEAEEKRRNAAETDLKKKIAARRFAESLGVRRGQTKKGQLPKSRFKLKSTLPKSPKQRTRVESGSKSEFATSIPDERTTVASLTRGGLSSPPTTPKHSGTLKRTTTPITIKWSGLKPRTRAPKELTRAERKKKLAATKARLGKTKGSRAKAERPQHIDISDTTSEEKDVESESESESFSEMGDDYPTDQEERDEAAAKEKERKKARARGLRTRSVGVARIRGRTNIIAMRAARAKQKKARQEFKKARVNKRHKISGHHPFVPKLQIRQKGPGMFSVRSTGITPQIKNHVNSLLSRLKGKLFVNGKFTNPKRAFSVIMALLRKKQVIEIQIR